MGRTACTEPQCLYKGALYLTVELYLYSPYRPYGLYRASCLYKGALYLYFTDITKIIKGLMVETLCVLLTIIDRNLEPTVKKL